MSNTQYTIKLLLKNGFERLFVDRQFLTFRHKDLNSLVVTIHRQQEIVDIIADYDFNSLVYHGDLGDVELFRTVLGETIKYIYD